MDILDWFNIFDPTHVQAWAEMSSTGTWPVGFIPEGIEFDSLWVVAIQGRMADQYCKAVIGCTPGQINDEHVGEPVREDSAAFADTSHLGDGDVFFVPNEGVGIGGVISSREREYEKRIDELRGKPLPGRSHHRKGFWFTENEILRLADEIRTHQTMVSVDNPGEHRKHDGFDTERGKDGLHNEDDHFNLDVSQSTLWIGVTQSTGEWLNASAVKHHSYISIRIHGPDGQILADIGITFEQFAAALTSNMAQPCTAQDYWSRPPNSIRLRERVKPPRSIKDRMAKRLWGSLDGDKKNLQKVMDTIQEVADGTKKIGKNAAKDLLRTLEMVANYRKANANFVVGQALEETTAIVEGAAAALAQTFGRPEAAQQIIEASGLGEDIKLLGTGEKSEEDPK
jgi:hypothetical protein